MRFGPGGDGLAVLAKYPLLNITYSGELGANEKALS